jgi:hypothetical protein
LYSIPWYYHVGLGIALVTVTWYLTIRGRGESSRVVFTMLGIFVLLTIAMAIGLFLAKGNGVAALPYKQTEATPSIWMAMYHMLTASMKGLVALSGLEAMSNGIQFVVNEDFALVKWGKKKLPQLERPVGILQRQIRHRPHGADLLPVLWRAHDAFLAYFAIHFNAFDGTAGRSLVATCPLSVSARSPEASSCTGPTRSWRWVAGGRLHDGLPGFAGHRMAGCGHRGNSGDHRLPG